MRLPSEPSTGAGSCTRHCTSTSGRARHRPSAGGRARHRPSAGGRARHCSSASSRTRDGPWATLPGAGGRRFGDGSRAGSRCSGYSSRAGIGSSSRGCLLCDTSCCVSSRRTCCGRSSKGRRVRRGCCRHGSAHGCSGDGRSITLRISSDGRSRYGRRVDTEEVTEAGACGRNSLGSSWRATNSICWCRLLRPATSNAYRCRLRRYATSACWCYLLRRDTSVVRRHCLLLVGLVYHGVLLLLLQLQLGDYVSNPNLCSHLSNCGISLSVALRLNVSNRRGLIVLVRHDRTFSH